VLRLSLTNFLEHLGGHFWSMIAKEDNRSTW
jgi:hypothetical protein